MKNLFIPILLGVTAPWADATLINVDFNCGNAAAPANGTFSGAGVLGGGTWNGIAATRPINILPTTALVDATNAATAVTVGIGGGTNFNNAWDIGTSGANVDASQKGLMGDYLYLWGGNGTANITLSGLPPNSAWNLVLYGANGGASGSKFSIGGVEKSTSDTGSIGATLVENDEFVRYNAIQADGDGKIIVTWTKTGTFSNLNGFQLESAQVAGPANIILPASVALAPDGTVQNYDVAVSNTSADTPLQITAVNFTGTDAGAFSPVTALPLTVPVSSSGTLSFSFNPAGKSGSVGATMNVTSNDPDDSPKAVTVSGFVADPVLSTTATVLDFGELATSDAAVDMDLSVFNDGLNNNLTVSGAAIGSASYAVPAASHFSIATPTAASIPPNGESVTTLRFNPAGVAGRAVAVYQFTTNDPAQGSRQVMLTGVTPLAAGALGDDFAAGYASSVWDNPWDGTYANGRVEFPGVYTDRKYLRTVAKDFGNIDFTFTATLNRANNAGGDGCAFVGIGSGQGNPSGFFEPTTGEYIYVRYRSKGWTGEFGDVISNSGVTGSGLSNATMPNAVPLRIEYHAATHTAKVTFDADLNGFDGADPKYIVANANLSPTDTRLFAGGSGGAWVDDVVVTPGVAEDPFESWADSWSNPVLADQTPDGDPDADGIPNLLEFVLGGDPRVSSPGILPVQSKDGTNLVLSFNRQDAAADVVLTGQWSTDLNAWQDIAPTLVNDHGNAPDEMQVRIPLTHESNGKLFGRLRVTAP